MIRRIGALVRRCALARAVIAAVAFAVAFGMTGYHLGHNAGRTQAHRETDRVLGELRVAFDGGVDMPAAPSGPETRHTANGDAP